MKVTRDLIENKLNLVINESTDRNLKLKVSKYFIDKNYKTGIVSDILDLRLHLSTLTDLDLGLFVTAIYKATKDKTINPSNFFTQLEINKINRFKLDVDEDIYPIFFENVEQINDDQWITYMTAQEIAELYNNNVIIYNPESQRALKTKKSHTGSIIQEIDLNKKSVQDIEKDILDGRFISNFITFNVLQDDGIMYNSLKKELVIGKGVEIDILDGFHRSLGILNAVIQNNNINFRIGVMITNFNLEKARRFIVQEDKKNKMKEEYIKSIDTDNFSRKIVKFLNEDDAFHLNGEFSVDDLLIESNKKKVNSNIVSDTIELTFNPKNRKDFISTCTIIKERLNYIIEKNMSLLDKSLTNQFVWCFYICLIYCSIDNKTWKTYIKQRMHEFHKIEIKKNKKIDKITKNNINNILQEIKRL